MPRRRLRQSPALPKEFFRFSKTATGPEHYSYPSDQARRVFNHVLSIGNARLPLGWRNDHGHEKGYLLHFIVHGHIWHRLGNQRHVAGPNGACLLDIASPVEYGNDGPGAAQLFWVLFDGPTMPALFRELNADMEPLFRNLPRELIVKLFRRLIDSTARQPAAFEARSSAWLGELMAELFVARAMTVSSSAPALDPSRLSPPVRKALAMVSRFYKYPRSMKQLAADAGVSRYHFSRLFHRETGFTPNRYFTWYRIEMAKNLLRSSATPIHEIGKTVGIADPERFSKLFRRLTGTTPRAYRQQK